MSEHIKFIAKDLKNGIQKNIINGIKISFEIIKCICFWMIIFMIFIQYFWMCFVLMYSGRFEIELSLFEIICCNVSLTLWITITIIFSFGNSNDDGLLMFMFLLISPILISIDRMMINKMFSEMFFEHIFMLLFILTPRIIFSMKYSYESTMIFVRYLKYVNEEITKNKQCKTE